jgi:hypothetical protein
MDLADKAHLSDGTLRSKEWFRKLVASESTINGIEKLSENFKTPRKISPGSLVFFEYFPKTKDKLPFWDRYPLVFLTNVESSGWSGLNVHYLHPKQRARMFYEFQKYGNSFLDFELSRKIIRKYIAKNAVRKPKEIPQSMWEIAIQLPFENFQKASSSQVWNSISRKK